VERSDSDHGDHTRKEEDDDERVHDREPLDVSVRHRIKNVIPSRSPLDIVVFDKLDRVGVWNGDVSLELLWNRHRIALALSALVRFRIESRRDESVSDVSAVNTIVVVNDDVVMVEQVEV
jgi:hypothetical protein